MDLASFMWLHKHGKTHSTGMYWQSVAQISQHHKHSLISSLYLLLIYHLPPLDDAQVVHRQAGTKGSLFSGQGILHLLMFFSGMTHGEWQSRLLQVEVWIRNIHNLQPKNVSSSCVPSKKIKLFLVFRRYPLEQYNYSEDTTSLYEMWSPALRGSGEVNHCCNCVSFPIQAALWLTETPKAESN